MNKDKVRQFKTEWAGKDLIIEIGKLASQADGAVTVRYGDTLILATAVMDSRERAGVDYLPLTVDYEEKFYAAGKIKGSRWVKREGAPSEEAILTSRLIDRSIRPLFDQRLRRDIQVVATVFSIDQQNDPDILSILGASLALGISSIPFAGPIAACRIVKKNDVIYINANYQEREDSEMDLIVAGSEDKINMLEGQLLEIPEAEVINSVAKAQKNIKELVEFQKKIILEIGKEKPSIVFGELDSEIKKQIDQIIDQSEELSDLEKIIANEFPAENCDLIGQYVYSKIDELVHQKALKKEERVDQRKLNEIRGLSAETGLLPRTHGSGLFSRGKTQVVSTVTLGSPGMEQFLDTMETTEGRKRFMHHYNFPPYAVGEVRPMRGPGRREIGHGALVEKALSGVIPNPEEFPYTIRLVSETLSSNGSSSMASVCASSLALMDAGVPIKKHVAGIAMGLMSDKENYKILTDIQGPEDHHGDMDLKVAGTDQGINALQMDVKITGVNLKVLEDAFRDARNARLQILQTLKNAIASPRNELSVFAPKIDSIKINPDLIGKLIGPGGKTIQKLTQETETEIDIEDDGTVNITGSTKEAIAMAKEKVLSLTKEAKVGEIYEGARVVKNMDFGSFLELFPGQDGLLHASEMPGKNLKPGDILKVKIKNIDQKGRVNLALVR